MTRHRTPESCRSGTRRRPTLALAGGIQAALLIIGLAGCSGRAETTGTAGNTAPGRSASAGNTAPDRSASASQSSTASAPEADDSGMYDVGGHKLYMSCAGDGPTTVVLVHGWVNDVEFVPHVHAIGVRDLLIDDYRVCLYDRRNVGSSETVDAVQTPQDMVRDMRAVLEAGGERPPYILWAGSFGGLVASAYLQAHPDDVKGMVFVDAMFPDELGLDRYLPRKFRFKHFDKEDKCCTVERISQFDLIQSLQPTIGREPDIPAIYLASQQEPRNENQFGSPAYDARILEAQAAFVDRFTPGILSWVDAPHFMEPVVPHAIADAVRQVDRLASAS